MGTSQVCGKGQFGLTSPSVFARGSVTLIDNFLLGVRPHLTPTIESSCRQLSSQTQSSYQSTDFQLVLSIPTKNNRINWGKKAKPQSGRKKKRERLSLSGVPTAAISHSLQETGRLLLRPTGSQFIFPLPLLRDSTKSNPTLQLPYFPSLITSKLQRNRKKLVFIKRVRTSGCEERCVCFVLLCSIWFMIIKH